MPRMAGRAGGRAETFDAARRRESAWPLRVPRSVRDAADAARKWAQAEIAPGRLMPWLPIAFGTGIVVYFTAEREPALAAAGGLVAALAVGTVLARNRPLTFPILLALAALAAGFATATLKSAIVAHPMLRWPAWNVSITGWIEVREERARTDSGSTRTATCYRLALPARLIAAAMASHLCGSVSNCSLAGSSAAAPNASSTVSRISRNDCANAR
jgi:hypothetical protein